MYRGVDVVAGGCDFATWVRPGSGIDQGQRVRDRKSKHEPYGLRENAKRYMQKGREGEEQKRREQRRRERREGVNKRKKRRSGMVAARKAGTLFS